MVINDALAQRLENAEALDAAGCAEAACQLETDCDGVVAAIAGGVAAFCGPSSPLTHALAVGLHGPVTEDQIAELEEFYFSRGAGVSIDVCPHSDPTLRDILVSRGYRLADMSNVLVRALRAGEEFPTQHEIREATTEEEYSRTLACGFFGRELVTDDEILIGRVLFRMPSAMSLVAIVDGQPAGACGFTARNGVGSFWGDATLEAFRKRGVHASMIAARLNAAIAAGCDLATAGTQPGSTSQRNYQKLGFEVAYTKITMVTAAG